MSSKQKKKRSKITANDDLAPSVEENIENATSSASMNGIEDEDLDDLLDENGGSTISESKDDDVNFLPRLTPEMKNKLDAFDSIEKRCISLEEEKSKLEEKIDEYLSEIENLKSDRSVKLDDGSKVEFDEVKTLIESYKKDISHFKAKTQELRDENDSYLLKISDLTFDNAKLTSQLQEIEKSLTMASSKSHNDCQSRKIAPSHTTIKNQPQFANPYLQNGYQDW